MKWALHSHEYRVGVCDVKLKWFIQRCTFTSFFILLGKIPAWNTCSLLMEISRKWGWNLITSRLTLASAVLENAVQVCTYITLYYVYMYWSILVMYTNLVCNFTSFTGSRVFCLSWLKRTPAQYFIQTLLASMLPLFFFVFWVAQLGSRLSNTSRLHSPAVFLLYVMTDLTTIIAVTIE